MTTNNQNPGTQLDTRQPGKAAIYKRPAAEALQTTHRSQIDDLEAFARELGYAEVTVFAERYIPGSTPLVRREAFYALKAAIEQPEPGQTPIQAIIVASVDRLFRSSRMIEDIALFIDLCASHGITVITPAAFYDFRNQTHIVQFCFACQTAPQSIEAVITNRLQAGKRAAAARQKAASAN